jgi:hypothetical protein
MGVHEVILGIAGSSELHSHYMVLGCDGAYYSLKVAWIEFDSLQDHCKWDINGTNGTLK